MSFSCYTAAPPFLNTKLGEKKNYFGHFGRVTPTLVWRITDFGIGLE